MTLPIRPGDRYLVRNVPGVAPTWRLKCLVKSAVSFTIWAAGGSALSRFVDDERRRRVVSLALAAIIVESVISLWVLLAPLARVRPVQVHVAADRAQPLGAVVVGRRDHEPRDCPLVALVVRVEHVD